MPLRFLNHGYRQIVTMIMVIAGGIAILSFTTLDSQATYDVAASRSRPAPLANCNAKADKLMALMDATAPVIQ